MQTLTVNNVEIQAERKPIKNLHLSVYPPDGRVHVSAPLLYSDERIQLYINKKWAWITAKRAALTSFNIQSPREYVSGEAHYFMGQLYRLKVERDGRFPQHVEIVGDYITVTVRPQAEPQHIEGVLYAWYKEQVTPVISGMVEKYSEKLGVAPDHWEVRKMAARWGSCSTAKKKILFNIELAKKPKNCIEYVVLHEMAHLLSRTHSKAWASEVRPKMLSVAEGCSPKALIAEWSQLLLDKAKADSSLVDAYAVYDYLMNYWTETMQDDCYMVSNDGWKVELSEAKKNPSFRELVCDLLPVPIVVDTYYSTKLAEVQQWEQETEKKQGELESLVEDNAEVFDMEKVNEANVKKAEKATTEPKAKATLKEYLKLTTEKKEADGKAKKAIAELTDKVREKYTQLTVNEVREMVVIKKWLATVTGRCEDEMQRVTQDIAASVTALAERYERTLGEMNASVSEYEKRVNDHLKKMGFEV